jgi:hypothetical protein
VKVLVDDLGRAWTEGAERINAARIMEATIIPCGILLNLNFSHLLGERKSTFVRVDFCALVSRFSSLS